MGEVHTIQLQLLLATFAGWASRQQTCVIDYLVEENRVLREQIEASGKRMRLTDDQRRALLATAQHLELVTERDVFEGQRSAGAERLAAGRL